MDNITIKIPKGERKIGPGQPVFIIAELSGNHHQNYDEAIKLIDAAAEAGVDAIKLQTYTADTITINCDKEPFQVKVNDAWKGQTLHSLYQKAYTPWDWQPKLKEYGESKGLIVFSTPFDNTAVDFLEKINVALYKVASFEVVDIPLLKKIGQTKKPVIMSRGMASIEELESAIKTLKDNGAPKVAVLHCVSSYPAKPEEMNLATIPDLAKKFNVIAGLSDHTLGIAASVASVALGACIIEKHLTLARADGGPDAGFSLEPDELKKLVESVRVAEKAIGKPSYGVGAGESENVIFRKSLFVVEDIKKGEKFTSRNVRSIRPGHGLAPKYYDEVINKRAAMNIERGMPLLWDFIEKQNNMEKKIIIRRGEMNDSKRIWEIRNHPAVKRLSNSTGDIIFEEHIAWFKNKYFGDGNNYLFVLESDSGKVIGYCRYDLRETEECYTISIAIDCDYHGKGLGYLLLKNSLSELPVKNKPIAAEIKKNNIASVKIFKKSGFKKTKEDENNFYYKLIMI